MAWIESHQELERHPKMLELKQIMGWSLNETIGALHRFWWWCVDYAETGDLRKYNDEQLTAVIGLDNKQSKVFIEAMVKVKWLERDPYFRIHDWWDYAGRYLQGKYGREPKKWKAIQKLYGKSVCKHHTNNKQTSYNKQTVPDSTLPTVPNQTGPTIPNKTGQSEEAVHLATLTLKKSFLDTKKQIYPMLDVEGEIRKCADWFLTKRIKVRSWERTITNWLKKSYDAKGVITDGTNISNNTTNDEQIRREKAIEDITERVL